MELILPENYDPRLTIRETQDAIKYIRDTFQKEMGREMHLERISAPLFVERSSGLNDLSLIHISSHMGNLKPRAVRYFKDTARKDIKPFHSRAFLTASKQKLLSQADS